MKKLTNLILLSICSLGVLSACSGDDTTPMMTAGTDTVAGEAISAGVSTAGTVATAGTAAGESIAGESTSGESDAGDEVAGNEVAGDEVAGDEVAGNEVAGDEVAGNEVAGDEIAGDEVAGDEVAGETPEGGSEIMGACTNEADLNALETIGEAGLEEAIGTCITMCLTPGSPGCGECISGATGLGGECTACFVTITECTIMNCIGQCSIDPGSDACAECRATNCNPDFVACAGIMP
jgi:hypothetical protein